MASVNQGFCLLLARYTTQSTLLVLVNQGTRIPLLINVLLHSYATYFVQAATKTPR